MRLNLKLVIVNGDYIVIGMKIKLTFVRMLINPIITTG